MNFQVGIFSPNLFFMALGIFVAAGCVIGFLQRAYSVLAGRKHARRILRLALLVYLLAGGVWLGAHVISAAGLIGPGDLFLYAALGGALVLSFPCAAATVFDGRIVWPWDLFRPSYYRWTVKSREENAE